MRFLISGSSGLIGKALSELLLGTGHEVVALTRSYGRKSIDRTMPNISWDPSHGHVNKELFEDFDGVIHLAGENIGSGRWTKKKKEALFLSRCRDTWLLSQVLVRLHRPPKVLISASAIGFYGDRGSELLTEASPKGEGFLPDLCEKWEEGTSAIENRGCRVIHARFASVLSSKGGVLKKLLPLYRLGLGGRIGSGEQMFSWIAIDDAVQALAYLLMEKDLRGPFNIASPHPVAQKDFARSLASLLHRPLCLPLPVMVVKLVFGEMGRALLLASTNVIPARLQETGFQFRYPILESALKKVLL